MINEEKEAKMNEIAQKYSIDLKKLEKEQEKLAKSLEIKDSIDFSNIVKIGGCSNIFFQNKIISAIVVMDSNFEIVEQKYFSDKTKFPYLPGFRAYRELPAMIRCCSLLEEKPELMLIEGHGISHPRLGIASHFSLASEIPTIGVSDSLLAGEIDGENLKINGKIVGKTVKTKEGARPLYVSPGNLISLKTSQEIVRKFVREGKKMPEPLRLAHKYAREVLEELYSSK